MAKHHLLLLLVAAASGVVVADSDRLNRGSFHARPATPRRPESSWPSDPTRLPPRPSDIYFALRACASFVSHPLPSLLLARSVPQRCSSPRFVSPSLPISFLSLTRRHRRSLPFPPPPAARYVLLLSLLRGPPPPAPPLPPSSSPAAISISLPDRCLPPGPSPLLLPSVAPLCKRRRPQIGRAV